MSFFRKMRSKAELRIRFQRASLTWPRGVLPHKSDGGARRKISRTSLKVVLFYSSITTNYITDTSTFFRTITLGYDLTAGP